MKKQALLTESMHSSVEETLRDIGLFVKKVKKAPPEKDLISLLSSKSVRVLCSRSRTQITKDVILKSHLDCIGAFCIGVNQIDIDRACEQAIPVFNAPYGNTRSVAEMVICFIIGLSRSLFDHNKRMHAGHWKKFTETCFEIRGKTLGIIGYGHIGSQVSVLAEALGMRVLYYDITSKLPIGNAKPCFLMKELISKSDFVTLHVPQTDHTKNLIGKKELSLMKKSSFLINTSRGAVIDLKALYEALKSRQIAGAAIDVFPLEPSKSEDAFSSPLQDMKNVILTPHVGGSTEEAQKSIALEVCKTLKDFLTRGSIQNSVNFPSLILPPIEKAVTRVSNIHKNQPGVLSEINRLVSQSKVNIKSQYLATNEKIGYLVMDLEKKNIKKLAHEISLLKTSIKTRIL